MPKSAFYEQGVHVGEVTKQGLAKAKTGTPQFVLGVKILGVATGDGSYNPHRDSYERTVYMALTEKTLPYVESKLQKLGFAGNSLGQLDPSHPQHQSFVGAQVDLYCKHEYDNTGNTVEKWDIATGSGITGDLLDQRDVRQLDALFGRMLRPGTATQKPVQTIAPSQLQNPTNGQYFPASEGITDDDIPF